MFDCMVFYNHHFLVIRAQLFHPQYKRTPVCGMYPPVEKLRHLQILLLVKITHPHILGESMVCQAALPLQVSGTAQISTLHFEFIKHNYINFLVIP